MASATETTTVNYSRIVKRSPKAVQLDLGEGRPVWFPLRPIALDEVNYTVTGPADLMREKLAEAQGAAVRIDPRRETRMPLPPPSKQTAKAVCIEVIVSGVNGRGPVKKELWFPKAQLDADGTAPYWLIEQKQKEVIREVATARGRPESQLIVRPFTDKGLLAGAAAPAAPEAEPAPATRPQALRCMAQKAFQP